MLELTHIAECSCGAITVSFTDGSDVSMHRRTFDIEFGEGKVMLHSIQQYSGCNHCENHWGIDLCGCGSGKPVGHCSDRFDPCISGTAKQSIPKLESIKI